MRDDSDDMVLEPNYLDRSIVVSTLPKEIKKYFFQIKSRFGTKIANIVVYAYMQWGSRVAISIANKILSFDDFEELIRFLESRAQRLGEGREVVSSIIYTYYYSHGYEKLRNRLKKACKESHKKAIEIYTTLASLGIFYSVDCIVMLAEYYSKCRSSVFKTCEPVKRSYESIQK